MYKLIESKSGNTVKAGDKFLCFRGESYTISDGIGAPPHKPSSTGKVWVRSDRSDSFGREFFPSVIGCEWVECDG